jgi:GNAT superfamily N-acetyltransferase
MLPIIRLLQTADRTYWELLWQEYLAFYNTNLPQEVTDVTWSRFMDPVEPMRVWGAFANNALLGIAQCVFHRTTWSAQWRCYLHDLFTVPEARGKGVARALITHVYQEAKAMGCDRVYWQTHVSNAVAQVLYNKVGERSGFIVYHHTLCM